MLMNPNLEFWKKTVRLVSQQYDTFIRMGCWDIVDIPPDTMLWGVRWVFKIKMIENEYECHKDQAGCERLYATVRRTLYTVVFANDFSGFLAYCYDIDKYGRIQILGFGCDIGLCVSTTAGGRNGVHGANSRFSASLTSLADMQEIP